MKSVVGVLDALQHQLLDLVLASARGPACTVTVASWPLRCSFADTVSMPFASTRNVTSTCGICAGIGGMPPSLNCAEQPAVLRQLALALVDVDA